MKWFSDWLSYQQVSGDRLVLDQTGLQGSYDFRLHWTPEGNAAPGAEDSAPSFLTALQEQLGLTLRPVKGEMHVLAIEHVERPTPD